MCMHKYINMLSHTQYHYNYYRLGGDGMGSAGAQLQNLAENLKHCANNVKELK